METLAWILEKYTASLITPKCKVWVSVPDDLNVKSRIYCTVSESEKHVFSSTILDSGNDLRTDP
jgi:hypothetical protein